MAIRKKVKDPLAGRMTTPVKWVAELSHVREVSLLGSADLAFWIDRLQKESLVLAEKNGKAQLLIIAADMKFMGIRFREVSFSVLVCPPEETAGRDAVFLVQAYNSRCLSTTTPCFIRLVLGGELVFGAQMHREEPLPCRAPASSGEDSWDGPIFLPRRPAANHRGAKVFFGKLRGHTLKYPFLRGQDSVIIAPSSGIDILQALVASHFAVEEWIVRQDATHAKSKTYTRSDLFASGAGS
jgi:hypothetical protein